MSSGFHNPSCSCTYQVFRLLDLPREIRDLIYRSAIVSPTGLRELFPYLRNNNGSLQLLLVSKRIYEEAILQFWRNTFRILGKPRDMIVNGRFHRRFANNVTSITYSWMDRTPNTFDWIASFPKLKELHLRVIVRTHELHPQQHSYQDEENIQKFSGIGGFDQLVKIRGLKKVTVQLDPETSAQVDQEDLEAFNAFLTRVLTKQRESS